MAEPKKDYLTSVRMMKSTANRLKGKKIATYETYDEIINRLIDKLETITKDIDL